MSRRVVKNAVLLLMIAISHSLLADENQISCLSITDASEGIQLNSIESLRCVNQKELFGAELTQIPGSTSYQLTIRQINAPFLLLQAVDTAKRYENENAESSYHFFVCPSQKRSLISMTSSDVFKLSNVIKNFAYSNPDEMCIYVKAKSPYSKRVRAL